jgi:hypothetical protein
MIQTQAFTAAVLNAASPAVTWRVDGIAGGNASVGGISASGLYTPSPRAVSRTITATSVADPSKSGSATIAVTLLGGMLTYHNDNLRSGQNPLETTLAPVNVRTATFGKLHSLAVDGYVYAQPLYAANVPVAGQLRNLLIVATQHNSVYAFDADGPSSTPLWHTSFNDLAIGRTAVPAADTQCAETLPEIGITSTPVIDPVTGTLYVVAMTKEDGVHAHRLHALDITSGGTRSGTGTLIEAVVAGSAQPNDGKGRLVFGSLLQNQRAALLLSNGAVYVSFASFCDLGDHHGWMMAYDAKTLSRLGAFSVTPDGTEGGIWQGGGGPAADADGSVYVATGDGSFDVTSGGRNFGDSVLKFGSPTLAVADYFTPFNQASLEAVNGDLGSGGTMLLPDQAVGPVRLMVAGGKQGFVYLLNRDSLGGFQVGQDSQIVQSFPVGACGAGACGMFGTPAYFNDSVYIAAAHDRLKAFALKNGNLTLSNQSASTFRWPGATPVVSADGATDGIVWTLETNGSGAPAVLRAHAAANVSLELYSSAQNPARDAPGRAIKFSVPTVFNGRVYVGTQGQVSVYGLLP